MSESGLVIRKDLLYMVTSIKSVLVSGILLSFCFAFMGVGVAVVIPGLMGYIVTYSTMAYEERSKGELLNVALPVTRKALCQAKYIESLIYFTVATFIVQISTVLILMSKQIMLQDIWDAVIQLVPITLSIGCIYNGVILPCIFKFGVTKARYYLMFSYIIIFWLSNTVSNLKGVEIIVEEIKQLSGLLSIGSLLLGVIIYYLSYRVSLRIWENKDFK